MMDWFARRGFDVWTMDHENYGRSSRTDSNSDIASGARDLKAAWPIVLQETGADRIHLFGSSSGALRAGLFATTNPDSVASLSLDAFVWTGGDRRRSKSAVKVWKNFVANRCAMSIARSSIQSSIVTAKDWSRTAWPMPLPMPN